MRPSELIDDLKRHGADERQIWHILTALRSCDDPKNGDKLKALTTARIRGFFGLEGPFETNPKPLIPEDIKRRTHMLQEAPSHFSYHYWDAVEAIQLLYKYELATEQDISHPPALSVKKTVIHHEKKPAKKKKVVHHGKTVTFNRRGRK